MKIVYLYRDDIPVDKAEDILYQEEKSTGIILSELTKLIKEQPNHYSITASNLLMRIMYDRWDVQDCIWGIDIEHKNSDANELLFLLTELIIEKQKDNETYKEITESELFKNIQTYLA